MATRQQRRRAGAAAEERYDPPYRAAAIAAIATLSLYALTLAPTTQFWDTSEYMVAAHVLGIPHPPGNPVFVLLARTWELLLAPTRLSVAVRLNLFSAVMSALAHGCWFLVAHRILATYSPSRPFRLVGAAAAVLISATAFSVWNQSNVNEKVYTVSLFTVALISWIAFRWRDAGKGTGREAPLVLAAYLLALSVGNHLMALLCAPALLVFVLLVRPRALASGRLYALAAGVLLVGLSVHLYLPIRAALGPVMNENDPSSWDALWATINRTQYGKPSIFADPTDPFYPRTASLVAAQLANFAQYFDWQWGRSVAGSEPLFGGARPLVTLLFLALGAGGAWTHCKRDRASFGYLATLFVTLSFGLVLYLNFRYGFSFGVDGPPGASMNEVRERDYFFILAFSVWGIWSGIGLVALWRLAAERVASDARRRLVFAAPVLALAFVPLVLNWRWASRARDYAARDWAYNVLMSVEPYGVLVSNGDNDTFPLWYLQEVEGIRQDVTVIVDSYLNTAWYARQLRDLTRPCPPGVTAADSPTRIICQRPYEPAHRPSLYAAGRRRPAGDSILPLRDEEIDTIARQSYLTREPLLLRAGAVTAEIPSGTTIAPADTFLAVILAAAIDERPIHFTAPSPAAANLALDRYLVRHGLTLKLSNGLPKTGGDSGIVPLPPTAPRGVLGTYVDVEATDTLLGTVFEHHDLLKRGAPWVDAASKNMPRQYAFAYYALAEGLARSGRQSLAADRLRRAEEWFRISR
jgi:hypothetical protein